MIIREIRSSDAEGLALLLKGIDEEAEFMLWEPGERNVTAEEQKQRIDSLKESENSTIFVADEGSRLVGFLSVAGGKARRNRHSVYLVIGILQGFRGLGIGTRLFQALEEWAMARKIHRLELTVVMKNQAGLALYRKMGFEIEGTKKHSLYINGEWVDEYYMAKLLEVEK